MNLIDALLLTEVHVLYSESLNVFANVLLFQDLI